MKKKFPASMTPDKFFNLKILCNIMAIPLWRQNDVYTVQENLLVRVSRGP